MRDMVTSHGRCEISLRDVHLPHERSHLQRELTTSLTREAGASPIYGICDTTVLPKWIHLIHTRNDILEKKIGHSLLYIINRKCQLENMAKIIFYSCWYSHKSSSNYFHQNDFFFPEHSYDYYSLNLLHNRMREINCKTICIKRTKTHVIMW
jgi:hypothetical protein